MIQCGQLDLHGLNEFILLRDVVFHVLRGLFRFSLNLVNLLRGSFFLVTAHRESGGGKERDEQFLFFHGQKHCLTIRRTPWGLILPKFPSLPSSVTSSKLSAVNQDNYDALVIGCGPGGSSAATFLPRPANASKTAAAAANA